MLQLNDTAGQVSIDGKFYRLHREQGQQVYSRAYVNEPPYEGGAPPFLTEQMFTWHVGGLKSRQGVLGTSLYGDTDDRWAFQMFPGPLFTSDPDTTLGTEPTAMFESLGYIFICMGRYLFRVAPATALLVLSKDFGAGVSSISGVRWEDGSGNQAALVTTGATTQSLWKLEAADVVVGGPDTWTQTGDVVAYRLAAGTNRLFKISRAGVLKNLATGIDPMTEANWADSVQVGDPNNLPTGMIAYERSVLVGKPEGLFGVGEDGVGFPIIDRPFPSTLNFQHMTKWNSYVMIPHAGGLYRFLPGNAESIGLENEILNDKLFGTIKGMCTDGKWLYALLDLDPVVRFPEDSADSADDADSILLVARDRMAGEPGFGPLVWDTLNVNLDLYTTCLISSVTSPPRLWMAGINATQSLIAYTPQPQGVGIPTSARGFAFKTTSYRYLPWLDFSDRRSKTTQKLIVEGKNLDANNYIEFHYSLNDSATLNSTDVNGTALKITTDGITEFVLPTSASGRRIRFRIKFTYDGSGEPPILTYVEVTAKPRVIRSPILSFALDLEDDLHYVQSIEDRTVPTQFAALQTIQEQAAPVTCLGPWGSSITAYIQNLEVLETRQGPLGQPVYVVQVTLNERETS